MNPMGRRRLRTGRLRVGAVQVLDVDVADGVVHVVLVDRVAGVVAHGHLLQRLRDGHLGGQGGHLGAGHHDVAHGVLAEGQGSAHDGLLHLVDVAPLLAGRDDHAELLLGVGQLGLRGRLDVDQSQQGGGGAVEQPDDRPEDQVEPAQGQRDPQGRPSPDFWMAMDLGASSPMHDVQERDHARRRRSPRPRGWWSRRRSPASREVAPPGGQGRLAHPAQSQAGHGDAELGGREVGVEVLDDVLGHVGAASAFGGQLRDARAAHLDDGELGRHEERVEQHEHEDAR